jgi:hypothetical protein
MYNIMTENRDEKYVLEKFSDDHIMVVYKMFKNNDKMWGYG